MFLLSMFRSPTGSPRDNAYLGRRTDSLLRDTSRKSSSKADNKNKVARVPGGPNRDLNTLMELQMNKVNSFCFKHCFRFMNIPFCKTFVYEEWILEKHITHMLGSEK